MKDKKFIRLRSSLDKIIPWRVLVEAGDADCYTLSGKTLDFNKSIKRSFVEKLREGWEVKDSNGVLLPKKTHTIAGYEEIVPHLPWELGVFIEGWTGGNGFDLRCMPVFYFIDWVKLELKYVYRSFYTLVIKSESPGIVRIKRKSITLPIMSHPGKMADLDRILSWHDLEWIRGLPADLLSSGFLNEDWKDDEKYPHAPAKRIAQ